MTRRRTPALEVADVLLRAARELLDERGPTALSVREIAARAEVAPMGVYKRFGSKNGILDALLTQGFVELAAVVAPDYDDPDVVAHGIRAELAAGMQRYRRFALANPWVYALMFDRPIPDEDWSETSQEAARHAFDQLVTGVRYGMAAGEVAPGDATETAQRLWATCHGAVSLELRGISFVPDVADHYTALCATLLRGLAPGSG